MQEDENCSDQDEHACHTCGKVFPQTTALNWHRKLEHPNLKKVFKCPKCPLRYKFKSKLKYHMKSAHCSGDAHICQDCSIHFKDSLSLRRHQINKHATINSKKACSVCQQLIPLWAMKKHMTTHELSCSEDSILCSECGKLFGTRILFDSHVQKFHQLIECSICLDSFASKYLLKKHMLLHADCLMNQFTCAQCSRKFVTRTELKRHIVHHSEVRLNQCESCGFLAKTMGNLNQHKLNKHTVEKSFHCTECSWTFKKISDLQRHQKSHSALKKYSCDVCGVKFKYAANMHRHAKKNQCTPEEG